MSKSNWPFGTDLSHPNFTGITKRESSAYKHEKEKENPLWWVLGAGLLALLVLLCFSQA